MSSSKSSKLDNGAEQNFRHFLALSFELCKMKETIRLQTKQNDVRATQRCCRF
jgi:hypothetical protein